jgi:hypothetical protein
LLAGFRVFCGERLMAAGGWLFNVLKCVVEFDQWQRTLEREDVTIRFPPILETRECFRWDGEQWDSY